MFFAGAILLTIFFVASLRNVPAVGDYPGPYGDVLNAVVVYERHVTNIVTAVNFDYRAVDTMIEESILFLSVAGSAVLLRQMRSEKKKDKEGRKDKDSGEKKSIPSSSDATRGFALLIVGPMVLFGLYIVTHGQLTPGGGFQGGVIIATAFLLLYLAGDFTRFRKILSHTFVAIIEGTALFTYVLVGFLGMFQGKAFLQNVLPFGRTGDVVSGGTIWVLTCATGIAVATGVLEVIYAFLEQVLEEWSS